ncbi:MAG: FHA domain-containing protein [Planctomycetota bacterium]
MSRRMPKLTLKIIGGPSAGECSLDLPALVGRGDSCDLTLDDRKASRSHARFELDDDHVIVRDLDSGNGTQINGETHPSAKLSLDDRVRIGETLLVVTAIDGAVAETSPSEPPPPRRRKRRAPDDGEAHARLKRSRRNAVLGPVAAIAVVGGLITLWVLRQPEPDPNANRESPETTEALAQLEDIRAEIDRASQTDKTLVARLQTLTRDYGDVELPYGTRSFDDLLSSVESRYAMEAESVLFGLITERDQLIASRRFGAALRAVTQGVERIKKEYPVRRKKAEVVLKQTEASVSTSVQRIFQEFAYLGALELYDESLALSEASFRRFAGTKFESRFKKASEAFRRQIDERAAAEEKALLADSKPSGSGASNASKKGARLAGPTSRAAELAGLLLVYQDLGTLKGKTIPLDRKPAVVQHLDKNRLTVDVESGEKSVKVDDVTVEAWLQLASQVLSGPKLLHAATIAYDATYRKLGDEFLAARAKELKLGSSKSDPGISSVIATARGLSAVPEGGYVFSRHGWESKDEIRSRTTLVAVTKLSKQFERATRDRAIQTAFDRLLEHVNAEDSQPKLRREVRALTIESLGRVAEKLRGTIAKRAKSKNIQKLIESRKELDLLRRQAIDAIYKRAQYDQKVIDEIVDATKKVWNDKLRVALDRDARRAITRWKQIHGPFFGSLRYRAESPDDEAFELILLNASEPASVRNLALSQNERDDFALNRRIQKFNAELREATLADIEKEHVVVLNDYREMLGRRRLVIDLRLTRAAGKHSETQDAAGRIWHNGPNGTPTSRAKKEGYPGGVGENVAIGTSAPYDIWWSAWYRSKGHHRNGLSDGYRVIGFGYHGRVGTQKFGSVKPELGSS